MSLGCAKTAAVFSVIYAGTNVYQLLVRYESAREKARMFSEIAGGGQSPASLRIIRALFYLAAPIAYLWALICAEVPGTFLVAAGLKFWVSSLLGMRTEGRLLRGAEYLERDHWITRIDSAVNIAVAACAVWLILQNWL
jgi:hypothetical protein